MRTTRLPLALLLPAFALAGCRPPPAQSVAPLPDTPLVAPRPPRPSVAEFEADGGVRQEVPERPDVRAAREQAERQAEFFANSDDPRRQAPRSPLPSRTGDYESPHADASRPENSRGSASPDAIASLALRSNSGSNGRPSAVPLVQPKAPPAAPVQPPPAVPVPQAAVPRQPLDKDGGLVMQPLKSEPAPATPGAKAAAGNDEPKFAVPMNGVVASGTMDQDVMQRDLTQKAKDHPQDLVAQMNLQMFRLLKDEPVPSQESLAPLAASDRDILAAMFDGLSIFRSNAKADPTALPSVAVAPLLKMADRLRERTELSIPTISLCKRVDAFGIYEPMPLTFRAGAEQETIIYCEVENFSSRQNDKQLWETKLSMEAVLYNSAGDAVLKGRDVVPTDVCRNRRRDFFVVKRLKLPQTLAASRYILKLTIVDENSKRVAENSLNIMMMAQ